MFPASFNESNAVAHPPPGVSLDVCCAISVLSMLDQDGDACLAACWKVTKDELDEINRTGRVWMIVYGDTIPSCILHGKKPFVIEE